MSAADGRYYAKGRTVRRAPLATENPDGSQNISLGFVVCEVSEWVSDGAAATIARALNDAPDLLSIARRWAAIDGGAWHAERHAQERAELLRDTRAAIAAATGGAA